MALRRDLWPESVVDRIAMLERRVVELERRQMHVAQVRASSVGLTGPGQATWGSWTPDGSKVTSFGTGAVRYGTWAQINKVMVGSGFIEVGTGGITATSGVMRWSLPVAGVVPPTYVVAAVGSGYTWRSSTSAWVPFVVTINDVFGDQYLLTFEYRDPSTGSQEYVSPYHNTPWAYAAGDMISYSFTWQIA